MREQAYKNLSSKLRGSLITPADGEYEVARRVYNGMIDRRPEAIVRCADVADIMTAVNFARKEDVLFAVRGGGGNFGIVTSFRFQGRPVAQVFAGPMLWEMEHARELLQWYREISPVLPEELYGFFAFLKVPPALQSMFDAIYPPGLQWYWKGDFLSQIPDTAIEEHLRYGQQLPTLQSTMHLYPIDGAASRVDRHETAFSYRDAKWSMVIVGVDPEPANAEKITAWTKDYWAALHPLSLGGAYVNFMMGEGIDRVKATDRENYDRLLKVKRNYDPDNFFRVNQNIRPD
jgi:FAD/FMN-containing dehydrogenase